VKTLRESYPPRSKQGFVLFLTGLYNSGKDDIAKALQVTLNQQGGRSVSLLLDNSPNASPEEYTKNLERTSFFAAELARAGAAVIAAPVAPSQQSRDAVQQTVLHSGGSGANLFHIHVDTPLEHCELTDRKGVYAKARNGEIKNLPGVDVAHETPERPDLLVDVTAQTVPEIVHSIILLLETNALV